MSTTAMWLLLAVVVIVIVFASVLYKRTFTVHELALTGVMAALSLVAYLFFRVPFYGGSSFHLGNTFTALTALLLDGVSGVLRVQLLLCDKFLDIVNGYCLIDLSSRACLLASAVADSATNRGKWIFFSDQIQCLLIFSL